MLTDKIIVKRSWVFPMFLLGLLAAIAGITGVPLRAEGPRYSLMDNWAQLPANHAFGGVSGVAIDTRGTIYVFRRDAGNIWTLDPRGKFVREWGQAIAKRTHFIRVDRDGYLWTSDTGGHQIKKLRNDGTLVMALGKFGVAGDGHDTFNQPSDVVVAPNGDIFVTDGYGNSRVVKFNKDGKYVSEWGSKGTAPGQFDLPHAIVQDSRGRLLVADRNNKRIQIFDTNGTFLDQWTHLGAPYGLDISRDDVLVVGDFGVNNGEGRPGNGVGGKISIADARTGKLIRVIEGTPNVHSVAIDRAGNIYAGSNSRSYLRKYMKSGS